jgi:osmotically-inducible protein OsmY
MDRASDEIASWFGDEDAEHRREMDQHRGKGPKGYVRTDERIREDVNDRLSDDPMLDASDIEVIVAGGEVTLNGFITTRQDKRRAEDIVETVSGVRHVQNNLRVKPNEDIANIAS